MTSFEQEKFTRSAFLKGGGALIVAISLPASAIWPAAAKGAAGAPQTWPATIDPAALDSWLAIHADGRVTAFTGKTDLGQGNRTALAQIVAEELDVPFGNVRMIMGDTTRSVDQGPTVGSLTIALAGPQLRQAAANGRQALLNLAAANLGVAADKLTVNAGVVSVVADPSRRVSYGDLIGGRLLGVAMPRQRCWGRVRARARRSTAEDRRPVQDRRTVGCAGRHSTEGDRRVVLHPGRASAWDAARSRDPAERARLAAAELRQALARRQGRAPEELPRRRRRAGMGCDPGRGRPEGALVRLGQVADDGQPLQIHPQHAEHRGCGRREHRRRGQALANAPRPFSATYTTPVQTHGSIGPSCALADVKDGSATVWSGTQGPNVVRSAVADALDIPIENVRIITFDASGCYGRNGSDMATVDAALMSQLTGRPVRVQWMRHDEHGWDPKGPATVHQLRGGLDANGEIVGWDHEAWIPAFFETTVIGSVLAGRTVRLPSLHLWEDPILYDIPASRQLAHYQGDIGSAENDGVGLISAWIRSPVQLQLTFASESFFDELAAAAGADPVEWRLRSLKDPRMIAVLKAAAKAAKWQTRPSPGPKAACHIRCRARARRRHLAAWRHLQRRGRRGRGQPQDRQGPRQPRDDGPGQRHDDQSARAQARDRSQRRPDGQPSPDRRGHLLPLERDQLSTGRAIRSSASRKRRRST